MRVERFFSIALLLVSIYMFYLAFSFNTAISYDSVGSKAFPILIFALLGLSLITMIFRRNDYYELMKVTPLVIKKSIVLLVAFFAYAYLFEIASFPLASMMMIFVVGKVFGGKTIPCLITAFVMSIGGYLLFDVVLDVPLPLGPFQAD